MFPHPEIILNCPPHYHQLVAAPRQDHVLHQPPEPLLLRRVGPLPASAPPLAPPSSFAAAAAQNLRGRATAAAAADPQVDPSRRHLSPSWGPPPSFLNAPLSSPPAPFGLQTSPPGAGPRPFPELARWPDGTPLTSGVRGELVPVGGPSGFCCGPASPPCSWVLLPEPQPNWCMCPRAAHHNRPPTRDPVSGGRAAASAAPGSEQLEGQAEPGGQRSRTNAKRGDDLEEQNTLATHLTLHNGMKSNVPPGPLPLLDEESLKQRAFEEYLAILDATSPQVTQHGEDKDEEAGGSFLELLKELCGSQNFFREVESTLDATFLDSILSLDSEPFDLLLCEDQEQELMKPDDVLFHPVTSPVESTLNTEDLDPPLPPDQDPVLLLSPRELLQEILNVVQEKLAQLPPPTGETSTDAAPLPNPRRPISDPAGPNRDGQRTPPRDAAPPKDGRTCGSPLVRSRLLKDPTDGRVAAGSEEASEGPRPGGPPALRVLAVEALHHSLPPVREPRGPRTANPSEIAPEREAENEEKEAELKETAEAGLKPPGRSEETGSTPPVGELEREEEKKPSGREEVRSEREEGRPEREQDRPEREQDRSEREEGRPEREEDRSEEPGRASELQKLPKAQVEGEEQQGVPPPDAESPPSTNSPPQEAEAGEATRMSPFARRTRSMTSGDRELTPAPAVKARRRESKPSAAEETAPPNARLQGADRPGPDITGGVPPSPAKRGRHRRGEEGERAGGGGPEGQSPTKRNRRGGETRGGGRRRKGERPADAPQQEASPPLTRSAAKAGQEAPRRSRRRGGRGLASDLPTKYKDFISFGTRKERKTLICQNVCV